MRDFIGSVAVGACLLALSAGVAFATNLHDPTNTAGFNNGGVPIQGQTGSNVLADCHVVGSLGSGVTGSGAKMNSGGGSPFNPAISKTYAGSGVGNPNNPKAVSQYDNACAQAQLH
jgi:hypothetical protein